MTLSSFSLIWERSERLYFGRGESLGRGPIDLLYVYDQSIVI